MRVQVQVADYADVLSGSGPGGLCGSGELPTDCKEEAGEEGVCSCGDVFPSCEEEMSLPLSSSLIVASCNEGKRRKAKESSALIASH